MRKLETWKMFLSWNHNRVKVVAGKVATTEWKLLAETKRPRSLHPIHCRFSWINLPVSVKAIQVRRTLAGSRYFLLRVIVARVLRYSSILLKTIVRTTTIPVKWSLSSKPSHDNLTVASDGDCSYCLVVADEGGISDKIRILGPQEAKDTVYGFQHHSAIEPIRTHLLSYAIKHTRTVNLI